MIISFVLVQSMISSNFTKRIMIQEMETISGVTKLRNDIYIVYKSQFAPNVVRVYEDRNPFRFKKEIEINEIRFPWDIGSSHVENCLYIVGLSDVIGDICCVWKITRATGDQCKIIKLLSTDYESKTLSVSSDGELLMMNELSHSLMIYGSD